MYKESVFLPRVYVYARLVTRCSCQGLTEDLWAVEFWGYVWRAMRYGVDIGEKQKGMIF